MPELKSGPLIAYEPKVAPVIGLKPPPEVARQPHSWVTVPPPTSVTPAVPPVQVGHTAVAPAAAMETDDSRGLTLTGWVSAEEHPSAVAVTSRVCGPVVSPDTDRRGDVETGEPSIFQR